MNHPSIKDIFTDLPPGTVLRIPGYIVVSRVGGYVFFLVHEHSEYITITPHTIEVVVPDDFNPAIQAIAALDKELDEMAEGYVDKRTALQKKREDLLALIPKDINPPTEGQKNE